MKAPVTLNALVLTSLFVLGASTSAEADPTITSLDSAVWPSTKTQPNGTIFACGDTIAINGTDLDWYIDPVVSLWDTSGNVIEPEARIVFRSPTQIRVELDASYPQVPSPVGLPFELRIRDRRLRIIGAYQQVVSYGFFTTTVWHLIVNNYPLAVSGLWLVCK